MEPQIKTPPETPTETTAASAASPAAPVPESSVTPAPQAVIPPNPNTVAEPPKDPLDAIVTAESSATSTPTVGSGKKLPLAIIVAVVCFVALCAIAFYAYTNSN